MRRVTRRFVSLGLATTLMLSVGACGKTEPATQGATESTEAATEAATTTEAVAKAEPIEGNIIDNPYFEEEDVSMWSIECGTSKISAGSDSAEAAEGYGYYGIIDRDPASSSPYDCFAQDVTAELQSGVTYDYEFYAKLSADYEGAPDDQRTVDFAPYLTVDGQTTYLGSYSGEITGIPSQALKPGEWTRFAGTFTPKFAGNLDKAVIRVIEQGTDYGNGVCVKGDYYITGFSLVPEEGSGELAGIETDIPDLRSVVASADGLGEDAICGTCFGNAEINDQNLIDLVEKHFNAVTLENELKMDCMFGYNNDAPPAGSIHEEELNGEKIQVPTIDHSRTDAVLDKIVEWNEANPDKKIRVRGHVLVWHSQAPEWFFHVDYDKNNDYVTADEMNKT